MCTSDKPGSHWVAIAKQQKGEFFYSYGLPPCNYSGRFTSFLNNNTSQRIFNTVTLQGVKSNVCGQIARILLYFVVAK